MDDPFRRLIEAKWPSYLQPVRLIAGQLALIFGYKYRIPYRKLISGWIHGFYGDKNILYNFDRYAHHLYLSDFERNVRSGRIDSLPYILGDKVVFSLVLAGLRAPSPRIYAESFKGQFGYFGDDHSVPDLQSLLRFKKRLVIKPRGGSGGKGIHFITWQDGRLSVNGRLADCLPDLGDNYIASEIITQHDYAKMIYPGTTNTLRVLTMWDYSNNSPFIAFAIHRFGTARSFPVDNWGCGALSTSIDIDTGLLGRAAAKPKGNSLEWHEKHPETGSQIEGIKIPGWESIKDRILSIAKKFTSTPYIGWDLVVTDEGFAIIEGNNRSSVDLLQIHRPLLLDERVDKFYRAHGVVC